MERNPVPDAGGVMTVLAQDKLGETHPTFRARVREPRMDTAPEESREGRGGGETQRRNQRVVQILGGWALRALAPGQQGCWVPALTS